MEEPTGFALADVWKGVRRVTGAYDRLRRWGPGAVQVHSRCSTITVMQPADLRNGDDLVALGRFDLAFNRRVAIQRQVSPRFMVVRKVRAKDAH